MINKLSNVPLMYQRSDGVCWYACSRMLYKWSQATGRGNVLNPETADAGYIWRYNNNGSVGCEDNHHLAKAFNLKERPSITMDAESVNAFFHSYGPIWAGVRKNWGGNNYGHVIVICGVSDTGVFVHDPMPIKQGSSFWLTWSQIRKAVDQLNELASPNPQFLSAV
jgi:hypothetical protein